MLSSRPFPAEEPIASAPFDHTQLEPRPWLALGSVPAEAETVSLGQLLVAMAGSAEAAAPILERIASTPAGVVIDFLVPSKDHALSDPLPVSAFHTLVPLEGEQQVLLAWFGQVQPQLEDRCHLMQAELERARRSLAHVELALRDERARVEVLLEACAEPASIQDTAYRIVAQNAAHLRIFGERRGRSCHEAYRGRDLPCEGCPMAEALETRQAALLVDQPDGGPLSGLKVQIRALPLFAPDHAPGGIVEVFTSPAAPSSETWTPAEAAAYSLRDHGMRHIQETLERCGGNRTEAARQLGISRATLWRKLGDLHRRRCDPPRRT
jgi:hypothetical protein